MEQDNYVINRNEINVFVFYLTNGCNLACKHCLFECSSLKSDFMDYKIFTDTVSDIRKNIYNDSLHIGFSGGEVFLHPRWREMIEFCRELDFKIGIITNGTAFEAHDIELLKDPGIILAVSVDGLESDHDYLRGKGQFKKVLKTLDLLADNDIIFNLHTAVTPKSLDRLPKFVDFILSRYENIPLIQIQNIIEVGRSRFFPELILKSKDLERLFYLCQYLKTQYLQTSFRHFLRQREYIIQHPCNVFACSGENCHSHSSDVPVAFNIFYDGEVIPLWSSLDLRFSIGNIREKPLSNLLSCYIHSAEHSELLAFINKTFLHEIFKSEDKIIDWASIIINQSQSISSDFGEVH